MDGGPSCALGNSGEAQLTLIVFVVLYEFNYSSFLIPTEMLLRLTAELTIIFIAGEGTIEIQSP